MLTRCFVAIGLFLWTDPALSSDSYEAAPVFQAKAILKPAILKGNHHTVAKEVRNDGIFNHWSSQTADTAITLTNSLKRTGKDGPELCPLGDVSSRVQSE